MTSLEGEKAEYDLLVLVPPHRGQAVIEASRPRATRAAGCRPTATPCRSRTGSGSSRSGDATDLPISKSGSTAHFEAPVVASRIASLVRGTAPKTNYGGRVMCFLETGDGRATSLRFDYAHPPIPPKPIRLWHAAKWVFNRVYWETVPQGRIPERYRDDQAKKEMTMNAQTRDVDLKGLVVPAADRQDGAGDQGARSPVT